MKTFTPSAEQRLRIAAAKASQSQRIGQLPLKKGQGRAADNRINNFGGQLFAKMLAAQQRDETLTQNLGVHYLET